MSLFNNKNFKIRNSLNSLETRFDKDSLQKVTLMGCQEDETYIIGSCTTSADLTNYKIGDRGLKITTTAAVTATARLDFSPLLTFPPASAIGAWVYIADISKISNVVLEINHPSGNKWSRSATSLAEPLKNGWNLMRFPSHEGLAASAMKSDWGKGINWVRVVLVTTAATDITIGHIWAECPSKAQILFIEDGGYKTFLDIGYPQLKARNIPVTWSLDPAILSTSIGTKSERISESDVMKLGKENFNSMNFHGYDGTPTSSMTSTDIKKDIIKAQKWLERRGFFESASWRSAWVQNSATNASAAKSLLMAYATPTSAASLCAFPPTDRWNIPRISLHGRDTAYMDDIFAQLKINHEVFVVYTHGIHSDGTTNGGADATPAEWNYFISKVDQAIKEGWLEGVTFEMLLKKLNVPIGVTSSNWVENLFK